MNNLFFAGGAITLLASMWTYVKAVAWKVVNLFIQYNDLGPVFMTEADAVLNQCLKEFRLSPVYDRKFESAYYHIRARKQWGLVGFERIGHSTLIFFNGWKPIVYYVDGGKESKDSKSVRLIFPRGALDFDSFYSRAIDADNERRWDPEDNKAASRYAVFHMPSGETKGMDASLHASRFNPKDRTRVPKNYAHDEVGPSLNTSRMMERLFYPAEVVEAFAGVSRWAKSKAFYEKMGIPWKRGLLLHGPGGTGKSALATAIAHDLGLPIYVFRLADMTNFEFVKSWKTMLSNTPAVALIEDIDNVFHGRENITNGYGFDRMYSRISKKKQQDDDKDDENEFCDRYGVGLTFDVLLNCIDGVERSEGVLTIITTNDVSKIDPALGQPTEHGDFVSSRPGRVDQAIELTYMLPEVKIRMAGHLLVDYPELLEEVLKDADGIWRRETPAQFQERIGQMALKEYWKEAA